MHLSISLLFLNERQKDYLRDRVVPQEEKKITAQQYFPIISQPMPGNLLTLFSGLHSRELFLLDSQMRQGGIRVTK